MEIRAQHKNARMSARKVRLLRDVVRGLSATEAEAQLHFQVGKAADIIRRVLASAVANAKANHEIERDNLRVSDLIVDEGFVMKRFQPVSRGRAHPILKRTSHVTVILEETGTARGKKATIKKQQKADIETISAADFARQAREEAREEADAKEDEEPTGTVDKAVPTKREQASRKMRTMQQGGDRAKTHRRKSMGD